MQEDNISIRDSIQISSNSYLSATCNPYKSFNIINLPFQSFLALWYLSSTDIDAKV